MFIVHLSWFSNNKKRRRGKNSFKLPQLFVFLQSPSSSGSSSGPSIQVSFPTSKQREREKKKRDESLGLLFLVVSIPNCPYCSFLLSHASYAFLLWKGSFLSICTNKTNRWMLAKWSESWLRDERGSGGGEGVYEYKSREISGSGQSLFQLHQMIIVKMELSDFHSLCYALIFSPPLASIGRNRAVCGVTISLQLYEYCVYHFRVGGYH